MVNMWNAWSNSKVPLSKIYRHFLGKMSGENWRETRTFLKFSKKEGGTITATTSAIPANTM